MWEQDPNVGGIGHIDITMVNNMSNGEKKG